jgi:CDP-6-deoxy-D-xylo-4-hexulose-3-dehydrase
MGELGKRVFYGGAVHDDAEIDAVVRVLKAGGQALKIGPNIETMEQQVAAHFGKQHGLMVNSGSSALFMAVELLDLPKGSEVISSPVTFSTDLTPLMRAGMIPAFVDVGYDTFQVDADAIEEMVGPDTRAILVPALAGNGPDWDKIRAVADAHGLKVIEDSCDAFAPTLRGTPTGLRSDISVTSFALSHVITCAGNGGMVMMDDEALRDRGLMLRRWGRRSEVQNYGSLRGTRDFRQPVDGVDYDSLFIFDEVGWNFEPSELGAAYGLEQLKKLDHFRARRKRINELYMEIYARHPDVFVAPRITEGMDTVWMSMVGILRPDCGFSRSEFQEAVEQHGIDSRTVWTGNAQRQPFMKDVEFRVPPGGLPNADRVFEYGFTLPASHGLSDEDVLFVGEVIDDFIAAKRR